MKLQKIMHEYRKQIFQQNKYGIIKFSKNMKLDFGLWYPEDNIFRPWNIFDPSKYRYLKKNKKFNLYRDSIYDYPIIAMHRLQKRTWEQFNRSIMIQVATCTGLFCWHCYLPLNHIKGDSSIIEFLTGKEIVSRYLSERQKYYNNNDKKEYGIDLFRIHGGEPFLIPELILEVLNEIKEQGLENEIYVWSETNLSPFYHLDNESSFIDEIQEEFQFDINQLAKFKNFGLHPCFHGISKDDFLRNTALKESDFKFEGFLNGFKKLIDSGLDIYPTFGSNVNKPENVREFFNQIKEINRESLRRFALIEYKTYYPTLLEKFKYWTSCGKNRGNQSEHMLELIQINNDKNSLLKLWDQLIYDEFKEHYICTERARVTLNNTRTEKGKKYLFLFKSFARDNYATGIQKILGLPLGSTYQYEVHKDFSPENFIDKEFKEIRKNTEVILFCVFYPEKLKIDLTKIQNNPSYYIQYIPLRYAKVISKKSDEFNMKFELKLMEFPDFKTPVDKFVKNLRKKYQHLPSHYECGLEQTSYDLNLISLVTENETALYELIGQKSKKTICAFNIVKTLYELNNKNNQSVRTNFYFMPVIKIMNHESKPLEYSSNTYHYMSDSSIILQILYSEIPSNIADLTDEQRTIFIGLSKEENDIKKCSKIKIINSDRFQTVTKYINTNTLESYNFINIYGNSIDKQIFNTNVFDNYNTDEINTFGNFRIPVKKKKEHRYFKGILIRTLHAIPLCALLLHKLNFIESFKNEPVFLSSILIAIISSILFPSEQFLKPEIKYIMKEETELIN